MASCYSPSKMPVPTYFAFTFHFTTSKRFLSYVPARIYRFPSGRSRGSGGLFPVRPPTYSSLKSPLGASVCGPSSSRRPYRRSRGKAGRIASFHRICGTIPLGSLVSGPWGHYCAFRIVFQLSPFSPAWAHQTTRCSAGIVIAFSPWARVRPLPARIS
jgi:hypothetical protein